MLRFQKLLTLALLSGNICESKWELREVSNDKWWKKSEKTERQDLRMKNSEDMGKWDKKGTGKKEKEI